METGINHRNLMFEHYQNFKDHMTSIIQHHREITKKDLNKYKIYHITPYLLNTPIGFPKMLLVLGGTMAGVTKFTPTSSIFIGFPSSSTLLYLLMAATASNCRKKTTSAVP